MILRNNLLMLSLLFAFFTLTSCSGGHKHNDATATHVIAYSGDLSQEKGIAIFNAYLVIKDGLVAGSTNNVTDGAHQLLAVFDDAMEMDEALEALKTNAAQIAEADNIDSQRKLLDKLSGNVLPLVKATGVGVTVYQQYCPMAFDGNGAYWLSNSEDIRNPYFGDKMLKCGKVVETIM